MKPILRLLCVCSEVPLDFHGVKDSLALSWCHIVYVFLYRLVARGVERNGCHGRAEHRRLVRAYVQCRAVVEAISLAEQWVSRVGSDGKTRASDA